MDQYLFAALALVAFAAFAVIAVYLIVVRTRWGQELDERALLGGLRKGDAAVSGHHHPPGEYGRLIVEAEPRRDCFAQLQAGRVHAGGRIVRAELSA